MRSDTREKSFDCVAFMREARDRISDKMATMRREEFHHWLRSYRYSDPVLSASPTRHGPGNPTPTPQRSTTGAGDD